MKHELLVPVGNYECLIEAINNGCDAVYLAGKNYGARAYADNFSDEELKNAIKLCHLYEVKVYITVNTLIYEDEISNCLEYVKFLHRIGVDAIIMQDIGLIKLVREILPNLEIHASTQMHNYTEDSIKYLETLGVKRLVFAREMSLEEIDKIDTTMEKEVFIHGSLCVSYSGECLYSKYMLDRSANRGKCAGVCRLKYKLLEDLEEVKTNGEYLLSPKDLCSINNFNELMNSNVLSFKIEGRMKSPLYVGTVTRIYKKLIDKYNNNEELKVDIEDTNLLKACFYREYTKGFLNKDENIMNHLSSNHIGLHVGKVLDVNKDKIKIKLNQKVKQKDSIRFKESDIGITLNFIYDEKDNLISEGNDIIYLDNFMNLKTNDNVYLTNPFVLLSNNISKKIPINMSFKAYKDNKMKIEVSDLLANKVSLLGRIPEISKNISSTIEDVKKNLIKVGNTPFSINELNIDIDNNLFIRVSDINNLRREVLKLLEELKENKKREYIEKEFVEDKINKDIKNKLFVLARTKEQVEVLKEINNDKLEIIVDKDNLMEDNFYYKIPRNVLNKTLKYKKYLNTTYASSINYKNNISDYYLNITNHYSLNEMLKYNDIVTLSVENNYTDIKNIMSNYNNNVNACIFIYGRVELMMMKACLIKNVMHEENCNLCTKHNYILKDRNDNNYPVITDIKNHTSYILNTNNTDLIREIPKYKEIGITNYRVDLFDEDKEITKELINKIILEMEK